MLKDLKDMETLSELGVLFLLYEQGLELSLDRLKVRQDSQHDSRVI
jgi:Kef-type K+ transport system membrane component KefB